MGKVKNESYVTVQGWMANELGLKGNELLIYAIIYGFSQDGENHFTGSLCYLSNWTNSTKQGVSKALKSLVNKGYLCKVDKVVNGVKFCEYYAKQSCGVCNKVAQGMQQSCIGGMQQSLTNNIDIYNIDNNLEREGEKQKRFSAPTLEDVKNYIAEMGYNMNAERFVDYYTANGWKVGKNNMKDWRAAVRGWNSRENVYSKQKQNGGYYKQIAQNKYNDLPF